MSKGEEFLLIIKEYINNRIELEKYGIYPGLVKELKQDEENIKNFINKYLHEKVTNPYGE